MPSDSLVGGIARRTPSISKAPRGGGRYWASFPLCKASMEASSKPLGYPGGCHSQFSAVRLPAWYIHGISPKPKPSLGDPERSFLGTQAETATVRNKNPRGAGRGRCKAEGGSQLYNADPGVPSGHSDLSWKSLTWALYGHRQHAKLPYCLQTALRRLVSLGIVGPGRKVFFSGGVTAFPVAPSGPWEDARLWALAGVRPAAENPEKTCSLTWTRPQGAVGGLGWAVLPPLVSPEQPRFGAALAVLCMLWPALWRLVQRSDLRFGCRSPPTLGLGLPVFK